MKIQALTDYEGWGPSDHDDADLKIISSDSKCLWVSSKQLIHHSYVLSLGVTVRLLTMSGPFSAQ